MLEQVAKKDKVWRELAYKLCGNKQDADDLIQDVYIKLYELSQKYDKKELKDSYVRSCIYHLFYDKQRQKKQFVDIKNVIILEDIQSDGLTDEEIELIERVKNMDRAYYPIYLQMSYDNSIRQIAEQLDTDYGFIWRKLKRARQEALKEDYEKKYRNKRNKHL